MIKRNKLEIIRDILYIIREHNNLIKITPLLRKSNMSSSRFKEYFNELLEKKLVEIKEIKKERFVSITEKGLRFLERYYGIMEFIKEFEL